MMNDCAGAVMGPMGEYSVDDESLWAAHDLGMAAEIPRLRASRDGATSRARSRQLAKEAMKPGKRPVGRSKAHEHEGEQRGRTAAA